MVDWVVVAAVSEVVAAIATAAAVVWAGFEFHRSRLTELDARAAEIEGVTVGIADLVKPRPSDIRDGAAIYSYTFVLENPGRLPITDVTVTMRYPGPVQRVHAGSAQAQEAAEQEHEMYSPAVAARGTRVWKRQLLVPHQYWADMRSTSATIAFTSADVGAVVTTWPSPPVAPSKGLRRRLHPSIRR